jgi:hypothetical protein
LACKWCRELDLDRGMKRLGHMESLPIVPIAHSSYIGPTGDWDLETQKEASDFGCLKGKWARFECKSGLNFLFYIWGQTQGVQIIEEASQWGWQRGGGPHSGSWLEGYMESRGIPTWLEYPENGTRHTRSSRHCVQVACRAPRAQRL